MKIASDRNTTEYAKLFLFIDKRIKNLERATRPRGGQLNAETRKCGK